MPIKGLKGGIGTKALGYGLGAAEEETEPNFNQTVLLLHADGSEGAGNTAALGNPNYKAFRDNSSANNQIVVNGDAYGNDFSPYYYADGYWSVLFDGNDNIRFGGTSNESAFQFGTGEFTIEFFVQLQGATSSSEYGFFGCINGFYFQLYQGNLEYHTNVKVIDIAYTPNNNAFVHFAISRDSSDNLRLWIDGTLTHTVASHTYNYSTIAGFQVMDIGTGASRPAKGYLSNFRVVKGSAVYSGTGSITVPTAPLTAISGTTLLACQSNRFLDNSTSGLAPTLTGDPAVSTNTPFTQSKTANVGSGFFDGTGDELEITNSSDFAFGTGDFQISLWVYLLENSGGLVGLTGGTATGYWVLTANSGTLYFQKAHNSSDLFSTTLPSLHAWHFIEVSRVSSTTKMFIDGVQTNTISDTTDYNQTGQTLDIGDHGGHGEPKGYIADVRIIKGSGVTSSTLPTTTLASTGSETKLLTCQYSGAVRNVGFVDDSKYNHQVTRIGDVSMGTFSPFSLEDTYWSVYFDVGTDEGITYADSSNDLDLGGIDAHLELWYMPVGDTLQVLLGKHGGSSSWGGSGFAYQFQVPTTRKFTYYYNAGGPVAMVTTTALTKNVWHHIAVATDSSNNFAVFINGTREATANATQTNPGTRTNFKVGSDIGGNDAEGYISNLRHVTGSNAYDPTASSITVPTEPLTAITGTQILTCQSNRFVDNSTNNLTVTLNNNPEVLPFSPFAPSRSYSKDAVGGSAYFDGTTDGLVLTDATQPLSTNNFEVEFWYYPIGSTNNGYVFNTSHNNNSFGPILIYIVSLDVRLYSSSTGGSWNIFNNHNLGTAKANSWNHIYLSRVSNAVYAFVNGVASAGNGTTWNTDFTIATAPLHIGTYDSSGSGSAYGYIANVQYNIGSGSTTKSVPTTPTTPDSDTYVQLNFNNAGIIDHTMKNNLETEDNTRISGQQVKFGTGSILFDGTNDEIKMANSPMQQPRTGEFTIEFFVYFNATGNHGFFGNGTGGYYAQLFSGNFQFAQGSTANINIAWSYSTGQWYHVALARDSSNNTKLFINGTQLGSTATSDTNDYNHATVALSIGDIGGGYGRRLNGYIDEFRITKGVARYTSNFTAPTKAFANK